jgi:hypothetical protein
MDNGRIYDNELKNMTANEDDDKFDRTPINAQLILNQQLSHQIDKRGYLSHEKLNLMIILTFVFSLVAIVMSFTNIIILLNNESVNQIRVNQPDVLNDVIGSERIKDDSITTSKIQKFAISTDKIADYSITTNKIMTQSIMGFQIQNDVINEYHLRNNIIDEKKIKINSITKDMLQDGVVTKEKIALGAMDSLTSIKISWPFSAVFRYGSDSYKILSKSTIGIFNCNPYFSRTINYCFVKLTMVVCDFKGSTTDCGTSNFRCEISGCVETYKPNHPFDFEIIGESSAVKFINNEDITLFLVTIYESVS